MHLPVSQLTLAPAIEADQKLEYGGGAEGVAQRELYRRVVSKGDTLIIPAFVLIGRKLPFVVVDIEPQDTGRVDDNTQVKLLGTSAEIQPQQ